ncbi:MAG: hypothetical protein HWD59_10000 [Coxiellaceae bacterium]|nr:MAG: hypothetical protein HWD59_10000 [Coxiellaceae bacterium]
MAFDAAAFISTIPQHYNNQRLTTEEWQALYDLYYKPTKVNILQLLTLLQIEAAEAEFMRNLIIYLWETSRSVFISAANNNKHRLKIQQAMTQYAQGESDSVQSVQAIAVQLNFMPKATVTSVAAVATEAKVNNVVSMPAHKPFHVAFAEEVMLPIPETPETQREIPTDKYVQRAERRFIEKQTEAYVQSSAFSSLMAAIQPITEKFKTGSNLIAKNLLMVLTH